MDFMEMFTQKYMIAIDYTVKITRAWIRLLVIYRLGL